MGRPAVYMEFAQDEVRSRAAGESHWRESASDYVVAVMLGVVAAGTAWCAYEGALWTSTQTVEAQQWTHKALKATELQLQGNQRYQFDATQFGAYLFARASGHELLAEFIRGRLSPSAKPAVEAWLATRPFESTGLGPEGPFAMSEYRISDWADADRLQVDAVAHLNASLRANAIADDYMFCIVLFAVVSLLCGVAPKLATKRVRRILMGFSIALLVGCVVWTLTRPIEIRQPPPTVSS